MSQLPRCNSVLIDARNIDQWIEHLITQASACSVAGFDIETHDEGAHPGIKEFRKGNRFAFDWTKMVVTGMSFHFPGDMGPTGYPTTLPMAYYVNLNHADVENRIPWPTVRRILEAKPFEASWICHNAPFEITVMMNSLGVLLENVICTLQMAVSAYGPDEYDRHKLMEHRLGDIKNLFPDVEKAFAPQVDEDTGEKIYNRGLTWQQQELVTKVLAKSSTSTFSYNGMVQQIRYGYGLKEAVESFFDYKMTTYEEVLGEAEHMGQLTGEHVASYGADDAYWAVQLFFHLYSYMEKNCPESITPFFEQENPMIYVYSDIRLEGIRINLDAVEERRQYERTVFAQGLRDLKITARKLLPFPDEICEKLAEYDKWYGKEDKNGVLGADKYRARLQSWIESANSDDDFEMVCQISSSVSNAWAGQKVGDLNIGHYYQSRLFMYDLCRSEPIRYKGKIQSDAESRGTLLERFNFQLKEAKADNTPEGWKQVEWLTNCIALIEKLSVLTSIETRMKLYLNTYMLLTDPETKRMYPEVSSMLATRRMAASNPNPMQLAKRGESTYVRGFYLPDTDDHVFVAPDWSQIELVLIGEFSGDPEFAKAFGQTPYNDLHLGAAADVLSVNIDGVTEEILKNMHKMDIGDIPPELLIKPNGERMDPGKAKKYWRTEVGKGSNFNYWYSGALSTVGDKLGWSSDEMWEATEAYRNRFAVAEAWRVACIEEARQFGFTMLPDGHRRTRYEATYEWANRMRELFASFGLDGVKRFGDHIIKGTQTRAGNQIVNAKIQGSCATLAKRSILSIRKEIKAAGFEAFFKLPIHDELVFSVHKNEAVDFIRMIRHEMANHPSIIKNLKIDCSVAMGRSFEPFDAKKMPMCLIELDEAPDILGFEEGSRLNEGQIQQAIDFMFNK